MNNQTADVIAYNGKIATQNEQRSIVEAVAATIRAACLQARPLGSGGALANPCPYRPSSKSRNSGMLFAEGDSGIVLMYAHTSASSALDIVFSRYAGIARGART